jgi:hypothetical protein
MDVHLVLGTQRLLDLEIEDQNLTATVPNNNAPRVQDNLELRSMLTLISCTCTAVETHSLRRCSNGNLGEILSVHEVYVRSQLDSNNYEVMMHTGQRNVMTTIDTLLLSPEEIIFAILGTKASSRSSGSHKGGLSLNTILLSEVRSLKGRVVCNRGDLVKLEPVKLCADEREQDCEGG